MITGLVRHSDVEVLSADGWLAVRRVPHQVVHWRHEGVRCSISDKSVTHKTLKVYTASVREFFVWSTAM